MTKDRSHKMMESHRAFTRDLAGSEGVPPVIALFDEEDVLISCFATGFTADNKEEMISEMLALLHLTPGCRSAIFTLDANLRDPETEQIVGETLAHIGFLKKGDTWDLVHLWDSYTRNEEGQPDFDNPPEHDPSQVNDPRLGEIQNWITELFWTQHHNRQTLIDKGLSVFDLLKVMGIRGPGMYLIAIQDEHLRAELGARTNR